MARTYTWRGLSRPAAAPADRSPSKAESDRRAFLFFAEVCAQKREAERLASKKKTSLNT